MEIVKPKRLHTGDVVGICSPSGTIAHKQELFENAITNFERATGLRTLVAPNARKKHYYSAGSAQERADDFHTLLTNPEIRAIVFSAGGDTAIDLLPLLDFDLIRKNPKIIMGISDATTLLSPITAKTGLITFLGLEFLHFATHDMSYSYDSLQHLLFSGQYGDVQENTQWSHFDTCPTAYAGWKSIAPGAAEGRLFGGNLQSYLQLVGTTYDLSFEKGILFLEAYKLPKKQIHKALMQLDIRGAFQNISGMIIGYCLECDNPDVVGNEQPIEETLMEIMEQYHIPIMHIGEIGHQVENYMQPIGARASIDADALTFSVLESVVA